LMTASGTRCLLPQDEPALYFGSGAAAPAASVSPFWTLPKEAP
jgi:hypothetical protein